MSREEGVEWCIQQCKELQAAGVPARHFYTLRKAKSVEQVARVLF